MKQRHLLIGLGELGTYVVESARSRLTNLIDESQIPEVVSIGFDLESSNHSPTPTISLPLEDLKEVLTNIDYRSDDPSGWKHWVQWFPDPDRCAALLDGIDSAGRSRPIGRLAFEINRRRIETELRRKTDQLSPSVKHQRVEILIVSSLMDGLGSGMLFDIAYLCRNFLSTGSVSLHLAIAEKPSTSAENLRGYQNTFAALSELRLFASRPQCFTPTWQGSSVFRSRHRLSALDQVYLHSLPVQEDSRWQSQVDEFTNCVARRCHYSIAKLRRQLLAKIVDVHFLCRKEEAMTLSKPLTRRSSCATVELTAFRMLDPVKKVVQGRGARPGQPDRDSSPDSESVEEDPASTEGGSLPSLAADVRNRISQSLQTSDAVPTLHEHLDRWDRVLENQNLRDSTSASLTQLDDFLRRVGHLFFSPKELKSTDRQELLHNDLAASSAEKSLQNRIDNFLDKARVLADEDELEKLFRAELHGLTRMHENWLQRRPGFERLRDLWKEIERFDESIRKPSGRLKLDEQILRQIKNRNRRVKLAILAQASAELNEYQVTRNFLRREAYRHLIQKLPGLNDWEDPEARSGLEDENALNADGDDTESRQEASDQEKIALRKLADVVNRWRTPPGERLTSSAFAQRLIARHQMEDRLLFYVAPEDFESTLARKLEELPKPSPFRTRVPPSMETQAPEALVIVNLPVAFFWSQDDRNLTATIKKVTAEVLQDVSIEVIRVPNLDSICLYYEEVGRPLHHLAGIVEFRDAYEHASKSQERATLHIDSGLIEHLPDWPETEGVRLTECPTSTSAKENTDEPAHKSAEGRDAAPRGMRDRHPQT